jgi:hypothetical protein
MIRENEDTATDDNDMVTEYVPQEQLVKKNALVAVFTDENDDGYFLIKANRESYRLTKSLVDDWKVPYPANSHVIEGRYYNNTGDLKFELVKNKKTIVHVNCILKVVSTPKPTDKLCVPHDLHENLLQIVEQCIL